MYGAPVDLGVRSTGEIQSLAWTWAGFWAATTRWELRNSRARISTGLTTAMAESTTGIEGGIARRTGLSPPLPDASAARRCHWPASRSPPNRPETHKSRQRSAYSDERASSTAEHAPALVVHGACWMPAHHRPSKRERHRARGISGEGVVDPLTHATRLPVTFDNSGETWKHRAGPWGCATRVAQSNAGLCLDMSAMCVFGAGRPGGEWRRSGSSAVRRRSRATCCPTCGRTYPLPQ